MRLQHRQLHRIAGLLDLVSDERWPELFHQRRPVDVEGDRELLQGLAFDHLARNMHAAVRRAHDEGAAHPEIDLDRMAGEIFPGKFRARQRLPHLLRR